MQDKQLLTTLEIYPWVRKNTEKSAPHADELSSSSSPLTALRQRVAACTACGLAKTRTQTVFGVGNIKAKLMIIGEAPGFYEDKEGEPFVGRAGQLLTNMLRAFNLSRESVYIANILKCRPPHNRDPTPEEIATCTPHLNEQINLIKPRMLLALGRTAAHYLLNTQLSLEKLRSQTHVYAATNTPLPVFVSYHPAYLLRTPQDKKKAYTDWLQVMDFYHNHGGRVGN